MSTTLTQRIATLLHLGKMPADVGTRILSEGELLYLAEGIAETAILRNFRAPGQYANYRRMGFIGYFALTERRIVVKAGAYNSISINMAFDDPNFKTIEFQVHPRYLSILYDPSIQASNMSGRVEIRLHLPDLASAARILVEKGADLTADCIAL